jgi:hypothetical protein
MYRSYVWRVRLALAAFAFVLALGYERGEQGRSGEIAVTLEEVPTAAGRGASHVAGKWSEPPEIVYLGIGGATDPAPDVEEDGAGAEIEPRQRHSTRTVPLDEVKRGRTSSPVAKRAAKRKAPVIAKSLPPLVSARPPAEEWPFPHDVAKRGKSLGAAARSSRVRRRDLSATFALASGRGAKSQRRY